jgi:TonB family protein
MGPGILAPRVANAVAAVYPVNESGLDATRKCDLRVTVGVDGVATNIGVTRTAGENFDAAAIEAVRKSTFEAGRLGSEAVPVHVEISVVFGAGEKRAVSLPVIDSYDPVAADVPPRVISTVPLSFSKKERRRPKGDEYVVVSVLVSKDGIPEDLKVMEGAENEFAPKAVDAVRQYRFSPATKNGEPIAVHISIHINLHIY